MLTTDIVTFVNSKFPCFTWLDSGLTSSRDNETLMVNRSTENVTLVGSAWKRLVKVGNEGSSMLSGKILSNITATSRTIVIWCPPISIVVPLLPTNEFRSCEKPLTVG